MVHVSPRAHPSRQRLFKLVHIYVKALLMHGAVWLGCQLNERVQRHFQPRYILGRGSMQAVCVCLVDHYWQPWGG